MKWTFVPASDFLSYATEWDALLSLGPAAPPLAAAFVAALLSTFGSNTELLGICKDENMLLAVTVLTPAGYARWSTFQPAQAPIGLWVQLPVASRPALLRSLIRALPGGAMLVGLTQCDPLLLPRDGDKRCEGHGDYISTARITIATDFDTWWSERGKNLRSNMKKQRNRLEVAGIASRLEIWRSPHQMAHAIAEFGRLESTGWKGRVGTAVDFQSEQGRFYLEMLETFCAGGNGSVYCYYFNENIVAMDLCIEERNCVVVLKTAYDESVPSQYSPALLMREEACRMLFNDGRIERIEFYGRVMEWHTRWSDEFRSMYHLNYYRWTILRHADALRHRLKNLRAT
ncbi:GNAT family N-acetyltransferase [Massilia sp. DWR3-1-1]|uniref:GNAT family N-acetyltransferase n=1 Tax=Massilia sp. DWR3-1-1 TaxID=2804559 RepID=UPI003CFB056A